MGGRAPAGPTESSSHAENRQVRHGVRVRSGWIVQPFHYLWKRVLAGSSGWILSVYRRHPGRMVGNLATLFRDTSTQPERGRQTVSGADQSPYRGRADIRRRAPPGPWRIPEIPPTFPPLRGNQMMEKRLSGGFDRVTRRIVVEPGLL